MVKHNQNATLTPIKLCGDKSFVSEKNSFPWQTLHESVKRNHSDRSKFEAKVLPATYIPPDLKISGQKHHRNVAAAYLFSF